MVFTVKLEKNSQVVCEEEEEEEEEEIFFLYFILWKLRKVYAGCVIP